MKIYIFRERERKDEKNPFTKDTNLLIESKRC